MTIAYSAPNWNQTNEATKTISSVAAVTGGIRVTSTAHGYANGDFIRHTGTTDYDGAWLVSNVAANTYDIVGQGLVFGVTRTGSAARGDKNCDNLNGLTNVTRAQITLGTTTGGATTLRNEYTLTGGKLNIAGAMLIPAWTSRLIFGTGASFNEITINSGGYLVIRDRTATSAKWVYDFSEAVRTQKLRTSSNPSWNDTSAAIVVNSGGTLVLDGGTLQTSSIYVKSGGTLIVNGGFMVGNTWWLASPGVTVPSYFVLGAGSTAIVNGVKLGPNVAFLALSNTDSVYSNVTFGANGNEADAGTAGGAYDKWNTWKNPNSSVEDVYTHVSTRGCRVEIRNDKDGSAAITSFNDPSPGYPKARFQMTREVQFLNKKSDGSLVPSVLAFTRDTNNGSRSNIGSGSGNIYVDDFIYSGSSGVDGLTPTFLFVLNVRRPTGSADPTPINDNRCLFPSTDTHRWYLVSYLYQPVSYDLSCRVAVGPIVQPNVVLDDAKVDELDDTTVAAYTTLTTLDQVYDWLKYWNTLNQTNAEYPASGAQVCTADGLVQDFGSRNVVLNNAGTLGVNTGTNTVTIKCAGLTTTDKWTTMKTSGTITNTNGVVIDGLSFIGNMLYSGGAGNTLTGVSITGSLTFDAAGTYTLVNCEIGSVVNTSGGNVTIRAVNSTITTNTGPSITIEYYSAISHTVKVGATPVSGAVVGYWDDTNTDRTYSTSFVAGALTSDGSGVVAGYVRYRVDGTTYTGINVHVGKPGYVKYKVPVSPTGAAISNDILILADSAYGATPSTGTTVNFGTSTITQAGAATTSGIYDYYIQQWFTSTNLFRDQLYTAQGAAFALASGATFTLSSGALTGSALAISSGATVNANGGTLGCGANVVGTLNAASPSVLTGTINMQGGTLDLANITTYQMAGSFASGTIDLDSISAPTSTTLDLRNVTGLGASLTVKNDSNTNLVVRISPVQTSPTLNTTGPGTGTLTLLSGIDVTAPNLINGTRVRLYNVTTATEIDNSLVSGGGGYSYPLDALSEFSAGDIIRISYEYQSGATAKLGGSNQQTATTVDIVFSDTQEDDDVYNTNAIDGSTVTGLATDFVNIEIDIDDPDNRAEIESVYAWFVYIKSTADGIRNWTGGMTAEDIANYRINTAIADIKLDNTGDSGLILGSVTPGLAVRLYRDDNTSIWAATSNGASADHGRVVLAQNSDITTIKNLVEADEVHTPTQVKKLLKGTSTELLVKNHSGTPLNSFQAVEP